MHDRRRLTFGLALVAFIAIVGSPLAPAIVRGPAFHDYAGPRAWLVLSNAPFVIAAVFARGARWYLRASVAAIAVGSAAYHAAPSDVLLALDWAPIALTLMLLVATVTDHPIAFLLAPLVALGSVAFWLATGGTATGGDMTPYVVTQLVGVLAPVPIAIVSQRGIVRWLLLGVLAFAAARAAATFDHGAKHVVAAAAAWCALRATARPSSSP